MITLSDNEEDGWNGKKRAIVLSMGYFWRSNQIIIADSQTRLHQIRLQHISNPESKTEVLSNWNWPHAWSWNRRSVNGNLLYYEWKHMTVCMTARKLEIESNKLIIKESKKYTINCCIGLWLLWQTKQSKNCRRLTENIWQICQNISNELSKVIKCTTEWVSEKDECKSLVDEKQFKASVQIDSERVSESHC